MAKKRRTAAEMAAARAEQHEEFERKLEAYRQSHTPEECSCAEKETDPAIFGASWTKSAAAEMTRAQKQAGCSEYVWRTAGDGDVCPRCLANADRVFRYDSPPPGGHPGMVAGCRCYAEPIIPGVSRKPAKAPAKSKSSRFAKILWILIGLTVLALLGRK